MNIDMCTIDVVLFILDKYKTTADKIKSKIDKIIGTLKNIKKIMLVTRKRRYKFTHLDI